MENTKAVPGGEEGIRLDGERGQIGNDIKSRGLYGIQQSQVMVSQPRTSSLHHSTRSIMAPSTVESEMCRVPAVM